ncbi:hypothetical protein HD806DRAFT_522863 [Xylariaceae sp. AK1471]|nr:hypothetical protein HD806DRAFT_522863 [Xylariaceae sp. AK1471]
MRLPMLAAMIIISVSVAVVIEVLAQKATKEGGLSLSATLDDIPQTSVLAATYLPTIIAILYSLAWAWVDLDVKRMQPWLELSKSEGATAENSILLDYPFEFLAFVPFKAAKRRHWPVFFVGTIIMFVFWAITPLQSSIFAVGSVTIERDLSVSVPRSLLPTHDQAALMDAAILNDAYAMTWLGQVALPSITRDFALLPFTANTLPTFASNANLSSSTWQITTDLSCWPATITAVQEAFTYTFDNGQGCKANISLPQNTTTFSGYTYSVLYIGYFENVRLDYYLQGPSCSPNSTHQFLAISATQDPAAYGRKQEITARFCEPQYTKRRVSATLSSDLKVPPEASVTPENEPELLLDSEFNRTAFEYLIGTGVPPVDQIRDYPRGAVLEQYSQLVDDSIRWPITNMVGFAVGSHNFSGAELHDPAQLVAAFSAAHKALLSVAVAHLISPNATIEDQPGTARYEAYGVVVSRPIAAVVEALLLLVATLASCTLFHCISCVSLLSGDPSNIRAILGAFKARDDVLYEFAQHDCLDDAALRASLGRYSYSLQEQRKQGRKTLYLHRSLSDHSDGYTSHKNSSKSVGHQFVSIKPAALSTLAGLSFVGALLGGLITLVYLKQQEANLQGLPRPSANFEVMQLLENYVPTVYVTLLEPFWVLINRLLCLLQPFLDMASGSSPAQRAVLTEYTSLPPQFAIWRSSKARHYLLTFICFATLLANVLAISVSGMFNDMPQHITYETSLRQLYNQHPSRTSIVPPEDVSNIYSDHLHVLMANLSSGTPLPAWTDLEYYYLPFSHPRDQPLFPGDHLKATTRGFGMDFKCSPIPLGTFTENLLIELTIENSTEHYSISSKDANNTLETCYTLSPKLLNVVFKTSSAREFVGYLSSNLSSDPCQYLPVQIITGWARADPGQEGQGRGLSSSTFVSCTPSLRTAMFAVTVDISGQVLSSEEVSDSVVVDQDIFPAALTRQMALETAIYNVGIPNGWPDYWYTQAVTMSWISHLMTLMLGSRSLVDPAEEVLNPATLAPVLKDLYQRLSAVMFGLNPSFFSAIENNDTNSMDMDTIDAAIIRTETRIFISTIDFGLSIAILSFYIVIAAAIYLRSRSLSLPRIPSSLGSLLAFSAASRAFRDFSSPSDDDEEDREKTNKKILHSTYTFGSYVGTDGELHMGIERDPFVVLLNEDGFKMNKNTTPKKGKAAKFSKDAFLVAKR